MAEESAFGWAAGSSQTSARSRAPLVGKVDQKNLTRVDFDAVIKF